MSLDRLSDRAQDALAGARSYAADLGHARVVPAHLTVALLADHKGVVARILARLGVDAERVQRRLNEELKKLPRAAPAQKPALDTSLESTFSDALRQSQREKDEIIRTHHILLAMADGPIDAARRALQEAGVTRPAIEYMLRDVREFANAEKRGASSTGAAASSSPTGPASPNGAAGAKSTGAASSAGAAPGARTGATPEAGGSGERTLLEQFGRDLTAMAREGRLDPVIGRGDEIRRLMQILGRRAKNNPILVGEPGVGKSAIVEGFAQRIAAGDVPAGLANRRIVELDLGALVAGTTLRGQFEDRVTRLVREVIESQGTVILYVDEIHAIVGAGGSGESGGGAANMLKPALARGEISIIGTTTPAEYRKYIESDKALERRFQEVSVEAPGADEAVLILRGIKSRYEIHHRVRLQDAALVAAVHLSDRYVLDRHLPDKAVDVIDEAASRLRMQIDSVPTVVDDLRRKMLSLEVEREALRQESGAPAVASRERVERELADARDEHDRLMARVEEEKRSLDAATALRAQLEATHKLVDRAQQENDLGRAAELKYGVVKELEREMESVESRLAALRSDRLLREEVSEEDIARIIGEWTGIPVSRMMESERQKLLAIEERLGARVIGQEPAVRAIASAVRRSRAGLQAGNRPIGNFFFVGPTGVGKTELAKALAEFLFDSEDALIRIDMSEYMEQSKVNTLIGAAYGYVDSDKGGILTEAVRQRPYSVVLFDEAEKAHPDVFNILLQVLDEGRLTDSQGRRIDFTHTIIIMTSNVGARQILDLTGRVPYEELDRTVHGILRDHFKPEFLNRLDDTIVFNALERPAMEKIADILMRGLGKLLAERELRIEFTPAARAHVIDRGYQPEYGARPLKRALLTEVQDPLALEILEERFRAGDVILADVAAGGERLVFAKKQS